MNLSVFFDRVKTWLADLPVGGAWARTLTAAQQFNLHWFWFDGLYASASDNIIVTFVSIYIIALGASDTQVGLMSSFSSIACALVLLPGALAAERVIRKKRIPLLFGIGGRLSVLMLVFVPILFKGPGVVWIAIAFSVLRDACNNVGFPAWMDLTNQVVPIEGRGRFFGSRNFIMSITGMAATLITGKLITLFVKPVGYQIALAMAFVIGMASSFSFSRITDVTARPPAEKAHGFPLRGLGKTILAQPQFIAFTLTAALWNFSIYITGPFFNVQMVNVLHFSAATIGFLSVVTSFAVMITQRRVGALDDRVGSRRLQLISMFLIPVLPLAWIFVTAAWQVVIINLLSGLFWGIFNLATFNLLLASIPHDQVPRFSAVYQIVVMVAMALGAAVGSAIINLWGFFGVLIASTVMRVVSAVVFSRTVHEPQKSVQAE